MSIFSTKEPTAGEFSSAMVENLESLVVKVGKAIPETNPNINHMVLDEWKKFTVSYFL